VKRLISVIAVIILVCFGIYGFFIEPENIEVAHLWPDNPRLKVLLKDKTAVHLSDLHMDKIGTNERRVLSFIAEINPDFIFLTGDYVKWGGDYEPAMRFLGGLKAKEGIWAVMGDYDHSNSRKSCQFCHQKGSWKSTDQQNVKFLRNNKAEINLPDGLLTIAGVDEKDEDSGYDIKGADIILSHSPLFFDTIDQHNNVLVLSGDTHGGQIPLPGFLWSALGYEKNVKYERGLYRKGNKMMYVSRGIGTSHIPFRFFRRPEVVVMHF
jgi:predicted MPP superfamily phosphohydrolase